MTLSECVFETCTGYSHVVENWATAWHIILFPKLELRSGNSMVMLDFFIPTYN